MKTMKHAGLLLLGAVAVGAAVPPAAGPVGFPHPGPIADADTSIRHPVTIQVPTTLKVEPQNLDGLAVSVDQAGLEPADIMVGKNMVLGVQSATYFYLAGQTRPKEALSMGLSGGSTDKVQFGGGTQFISRGSSKVVPEPGKTYVIEMDLSVFETNVPAQHGWPVGVGVSNSKALWTRTLKQTVEIPPDKSAPLPAPPPAKVPPMSAASTPSSTPAKN